MLGGLFRVILVPRGGVDGVRVELLPRAAFLDLGEAGERTRAVVARAEPANLDRLAAGFRTLAVFREVAFDIVSVLDGVHRLGRERRVAAHRHNNRIIDAGTENGVVPHVGFLDAVGVELDFHGRCCPSSCAFRAQVDSTTL